MPCRTFTLPGGGAAIVCGRAPRPKPCCVCGRPAPKLCDGPARGGRTCDAPVCDAHATVAGPDRDLCPAHAPPPAACVVVHTARIDYRGDDRLDVTRKSAGTEGLAFAPSWVLLRLYLAKRRGEALTDADWTAYAAAYTEEMRRSYVRRRAAWAALLRRERAVLLCYCAHPTQCHRFVLARILEKLGATYAGERA